jgi:hypothetical protein
MSAASAFSSHFGDLRARAKQAATAVALAVFIAVLALASPTPSLAQGVVQVAR